MSESAQRPANGWLAIALTAEFLADWLDVPLADPAAADRACAVAEDETEEASRGIYSREHWGAGASR